MMRDNRVQGQNGMEYTGEAYTVNARKKGNDYRGRRFGKLTALEPTPQRKNGYVLWRCKCDCGGEILVPSRNLKNGWASDCGCRPQKKRRMDLTGQRFGRLTVLEDTGRYDRYGSCIWRCKCDCGNETETTAGQLRAGYVKSCGCLSHPPKKDWIGKQFGSLEVVSYAGKWNRRHYWHCRCLCGCGRELDVSQSSLQTGHTKGCGSLEWNAVRKLEGRSFGDLTVLSYAGKRNGNHYWNCRCVCGRETEVSQVNLLSGHTKSCGCRAVPDRTMHFVEGTCLEILRPGRLAENNTSGIRGVYQDRRSGKWVAQITFKGKTSYLGSFQDKEEAARARSEGERVYQEILARYGMPYHGSGETDRDISRGDERDHALKYHSSGEKDRDVSEKRC